MNRNRTLIASTIALAGLGAGLAGFGLRGSPIEVVPATTMAALETNTGTNAGLTTETYTVDPVHTNVIFKIRHGSVTNFYGRFNQVDGTIDFDSKDITNSSLSFKIPVSSVDTNSKTRDGHIKDAEFFNARQFKDITFESSSISEAENGEYTLTGELTLHGITKEINATLAEVRTGTFRDRPVLGFEARFAIQRSDFEIMKYLAEDLSDNGPLGNTVEIIVAVEAGIQ